MILNSNGDVPTVHITSNRNRVKTYGNVAYMKSGTNFEIEIFNPTQGRLLANISIDGRNISTNGLVINPGQRVYLERWLDEARKFKFSTYEVENSAPAKKAIEQNGKIEVSLYSETINLSNNFWNYNTGTINLNSGIGTFTAPPFGGTTTTNIFYSSNIDTSLTNGVYGIRGANGAVGVSGVDGILNEKSIETGRTEKGEKSDQGFEQTTGDFNSWPMMTVNLQILPESAKPVEIEKIRSYCTECGTRVRATSWKFCPSCGKKL